MKSFLLKCSLYLAILFLLFLLVPLLKKNTVSADYMSAIIDKHRHLDSVKGRRIILGGGSNLAFGIDSRNLEEEFNIPVINLGLHAGLGLEFMLNELKSVIRPGDIVFLSTEYFLSRNGSYDVKQNTSEYYAPAKHYYERDLVSHIEVLLRRNQQTLKDFIFNKDTIKTLHSRALNVPIYSRKSFSSHGDVVGHLSEPDPGYINDRVVLSYYRWDGIELLNVFNQFAMTQKVPVYFMFPQYPQTDYSRNEAVLKRYERDLITGLQMPILNRIDDAVMADSLFFDTVYHLKSAGRDERTSRFVTAIRQSSLAIGSITRQ